MNIPIHTTNVKVIERMLLTEKDNYGRITVRSMDRIHARTGVTYITISEIARRLEKRSHDS
jgi:hypothetical protein